MPCLVLGPMLRYADPERATVWVETDAPCRVEVNGAGPPARADTFTVHGHHYALVVVEGLAPGAGVPYTVSLDGRQVWPEPASPYPPSRIRTPRGGRRVRLLFGSCRTSVPHTPEEWREHGVDALRAYARRMTSAPDEAWPDALLMLGDQVYADDTSPVMKGYLRRRRDTSVPPGEEVADFEEYTRLYQVAWSDPDVRWLLSTVPTAMIFDDHDIRDDWNASQAWRAQMSRAPWWRRRVVGGLGSYWLYQHLGNLAPAELAKDEVYAAVRQAGEDGGDAGDVIDAFAEEADAEPARYRWSFVRDIGRVRVLVVDSRCGRVLDPGRRRIVDAEEWSWVEDQAAADVDHLVLGTSLPYLVPLGIHHLEGWNEAVCDGAWGRRAARVGERIRQGLDLEHWSAFRGSFDAMTALLRRESSRPGGPASLVVASGDVHYSYVARLDAPEGAGGASPVVQAVCSPIRNPLSRRMRYTNGFAQFALARAVGRALAWGARVRPSGARWDTEGGPWFDNALASLLVDGADARLRWETAVLEDGREVVRTAGEVPVTRP